MVDSLKILSIILVTTNHSLNKYIPNDHKSEHITDFHYQISNAFFAGESYIEFCFSF